MVKGFDRRVERIMCPFFYLPFMHSETLVGQVAGMMLYEGLVGRCEGNGGGVGGEIGDEGSGEEQGQDNVGGNAVGGEEKGGQDEWPMDQTRDFARDCVSFGRKHVDVVERFGRFPSRNQALGRVNTMEEDEFLKEHPSGF